MFTKIPLNSTFYNKTLIEQKTMMLVIIAISLAMVGATTAISLVQQVHATAPAKGFCYSIAGASNLECFLIKETVPNHKDRMVLQAVVASKIISNSPPTIFYFI
jgi:hypothetical protein